MTIEPTKVMVGGHEFSIGRLDLFEALNVSRLVSPILPVLFGNVLSKIVEAFEKSKDSEGATDEDRLNEIAFLITSSQPCLQVLAQMPKEDFETVIKTCLGCVEIKNDAGTWTRLMSNGVLVRQDLNQTEALILTVRVICRELRPFAIAVGL